MYRESQYFGSPVRSRTERLAAAVADRTAREPVRVSSVRGSAEAQRAAQDPPAGVRGASAAWYWRESPLHAGALAAVLPRARLCAGAVPCSRSARCRGNHLAAILSIDGSGARSGSELA